MFFNGWAGLGRTLVMAVCGYFAMIFLLRVSGKRTLSKMNAFDLVVTVALGSVLATIILSKDVALAEGVVAIASLVVLQFVLTWLSVRSRAVSQLIKSEPSLLFYQGEFLPECLKQQRVTEDEVRAAIRASGFASLEAVEAVILETDGSLTAIPHPAPGKTTTAWKK